MRRTLLISNDFPPRAGGIQSYVHELAGHLPAADLVVYAPAWTGAAEFDAAQAYPVHRHPTSLMVPTPDVVRMARSLIDQYRLTAVWYGAAAPLALLTPALRRHGIVRTVASTHGHEVGWSMLPGSRQLLRRIGRTNDVITFVSRYSRTRIASALGPDAALEYLPPGVDAAAFRPDPAQRAALRERWGIGDRPVVVAVSRLVRRKGQDVLVQAWPQVLAGRPDAVLLIVGGGSEQARLESLVDRHALRDNVIVTGPVPHAELAGYYAAGDVFAMPVRTRGRGLDVEGLGIVFLEASAAGLPVIVGDSGGAPETVRPGITGLVVDGRDTAAVAAACRDLLADRLRARRLGAAGKRWVSERWTWAASGERLVQLLA
ncbi:MAG: glycosyltransferase family 4 protein [Nakamurella sp.]